MLVHVRKKYACKNGEETVKRAPLPKHPIPKSIATPGLLSHLIVSKYKDHLPLYRMEFILNRMGVDIARKTLSSWMIKSATLLTPLIRLMQSKMRGYDVAYADETPMQVLSEPGRAPERKSYMWVFGGGPPEQMNWLYFYSSSRSHEVPLEHLGDYSGYLHCDGYKGYDALSHRTHTIQVACWAHCRRKFIEAKKLSRKPGLASWWLNHLQKLFKLESIAKKSNIPPAEIYEMRQTKALPILNKMRAWLTENISKVPKESTLGKAFIYADNQWEKLLNYCEDGRLEMTNNRTERRVKPFTIGRKNWLFCQMYF